MKTLTANIRKVGILSLVVLCGAASTGCLTMPEENRDENFAEVAVEIRPGKISPVADFRVKEMVVTLASTSGEILRDTITEAGSLLSKVPVRLASTQEDFQIIHPIYALDASKEWTITVKSTDSRDSVVHLDSALAGGLAPRMMRNVRMTLAPRFATYEAHFSIPSGMAEKGAQLQRVEAVVDGAPACAANAGTGNTVKLVCNYLPAGNHTLMLNAYGHDAGNTAQRLLFKGEADVFVTSGEAAATTVELAAADESMGNVGMQVKLGRVGRVTMNVIMPEAVGI